MKHDPVAAAQDEAEPLADYIPVVRRAQWNGWTAERQRTFLTALAETGCISEACRQAQITARSAYRLRAHASGDRFARAWDQALRHATAKLLTLAYERAVRGSVHEHWRGNRLVAESRAPSDRLLVFLLSHLAPWNAEPGTRWARLDAMSARAAAELPPLLETLSDSKVPADMLTAADFNPAPPNTAHDPSSNPFDEDACWEDGDGRNDSRA